MMKKLALTIIILFCLIITACSFVPRSTAAFPAELRTVYFSSEKPDSVLSIQLNELFRSMNVHFAKQKSHTPFSILVSNDNFIYSRPGIVSSTLPTSIGYSQSVTISIENNRNNTIIISHAFSASQSITLNANQSYTTNMNLVVQQALNNEIISLIYYWLISSNTQAALNHANHTQTP